MLTADQVRDLLRAHIAHRYGSHAEAARMWGVTPPFVTMVLGGSKLPTAVMLAELGLERAVMYRKRP